MVYTNYMTDDGTLPTTMPSPGQPAQPQPEQTVFQQPTSGFLDADESPNVPPIYEDRQSKPQQQAQQVEPQPSVVERYTPPEPTPERRPDPDKEKSTSQETEKPAAQRQASTTNTESSEEADELDYSGYFPDAYRPQPEELLYAWEAPSRPFKKHNRNYYTTIAVIVLLISLILIFAGQFVPMAVVCAVAFMIYVINSVPPQEIQYAITTYGVRIGEKLYYWDVMTRFWYDSKYDQKLLHIEIIEFPERLTLVVGDAKQEVLTSIFSELLLLEKPPLSVYERIAAWLQDKFPLDLDS